MMTFTIRHRPSGKWALLKGEVPIFDEFESLTDAEAGMRRIINPVIMKYDDAGRRVYDEPPDNSTA